MWICKCNVEIKQARVDVLPKTVKSVTEWIVYDDHSHGFDCQSLVLYGLFVDVKTVNQELFCAIL